jgi:peptidoglycan/xylan/chitin deacetylase (PgdA/CDA1 family)
MFIPVLAYHKIADGFDLGINHVPTAAFEQQIRYLFENKYTSVKVSQLLEYSRHPESAKYVAITFDDAYQSVFDIALPVLQQYGFKATIFVITDFIGKPNSWDYSSTYVVRKHCSWGQLKELRDSDWEIGSHTKSHPHLPFIDATRLTAELHDSRMSLEKELNINVQSLAYPYGLFDDDVISNALTAGYTYGCCMGRGSKHYNKHPLQIFRRGVYRYEPMFLFKSKLQNNTLSKLNDLKQSTISACAQSTVLRHYLKHR